MVSVKDQVCMMFGKHVADTLEAEGLLFRPLRNTPPTHWEVVVTVVDEAEVRKHVYPNPGALGKGLWDDSGRPKYGFGSQLSAVLWPFYYGTDLVLTARQTFDNQRTAKSMAKMATKYGLDVRIVPLALVPVEA